MFASEGGEINVLPCDANYEATRVPTDRININYLIFKASSARANLHLKTRQTTL